ncbi:MAG: DUF3604 domain-containing protein [Lentisphaerae bacterium]|nr:DUF3604 domain-containing protein [Lentisphaerota bacterium]
MSLCFVDDPRAYCSMTRQFTYRCIWRPESHLDAGTLFEVRSHCLGEPVEFEMTVIPPVWAGINNLLSVWTIRDGRRRLDQPEPSAERESGSECLMRVVAGPVERVSVYSRPMPGPDGTVRTAMVPEDRFGNPGRFAHPVACKLEWGDATRALELDKTVILALPAPTGTARARLSVSMRGLAANENIANGIRDGGTLLVTGNPVWPAGPDGLKAGFGEFHWHTEISGDGQRTLRAALHAARDTLNMDFAAPGDHNPVGDKWADTVAALDEFNDDQRFATFFGWEYSQPRGHENYYFPIPDHPLRPDTRRGFEGVDRNDVPAHLKKVYAEAEFIAIPHHTNSVAETRRLEDDMPFWHPYKWGEPAAHLRLVEIFQVRGNQERNVYDDAWRGWHQNHGASVQDALADGHKLGFVGGTDNHCGWPGRAFSTDEGLGVHPAKSVILTGVWTPRIERKALYEALRARHTWAVWDTRALVWFTVNGAPAGSETALLPGQEAVARIRLSAEDVLQTVELVSEGRIIWQSSFDELDLDIEAPLGCFAQSTHVYLRALQRNGGIIYASPVYIAV